MNNFGLGHLGQKNLLKVPGRSVGGQAIWTTLNNVNAGTNNYSSTDVGSYIYLFSGTIITVGFTFTALQVLGQVQLRHSGAPASVDVLLFIDYGRATGSGVYMAYSEAELISSTTLWTTCTISRTARLDIAGTGLLPGAHTVGMVVRNNTAGTLEMKAASATNAMNYIDTMEVSWKQANA